MACTSLNNESDDKDPIFLEEPEEKRKAMKGAQILDKDRNCCPIKKGTLKSGF